MDASLLKISIAEVQSMSTEIPSDIADKFQAKYDWLKRKQFPSIGDPDANGIRQFADGSWTCHYGNTANPDWCGCTIVARSGDVEPREVHGKICERWLQEGGVSGWLGLPVSDEQIFEGNGDPLDRISHFENGDIICTSKTVSTRIVNIKGRLSWYNRRHNQLLDLLRQAVEAAAEDPVKRHSEAIKVVEDKCKEDQFDIVLLGEFQDGKSTTLDVLCGGRELSPQGKGTKSTSAVPVSIQRLSDRETEEWGEVRFKTKSELAGEIYDAFEDAMQGESVAEAVKPLQTFVQGDNGESGSARERFRNRFDLDNPQHLDILRKTLRAEWERYERSRKDFASRYRQHMEALTLVARYWDSKEIASCRQQSRCKVTEVGKFVFFPKDWKARSVQGFNSDVSPSESVFAFVDKTILHIRSEILSEIDCRVTDCPGLGASAYDTDVARRALDRADGIWFIKRCEGKQLSASDLGAVFNLVKNTNRLSRTCFGLNLWNIDMREACEDDDENGQSIVNYIFSQLKTEGYEFPAFWFHVLFAYLSRLGKNRLESGNEFSPDERKWLARVARIERPETLPDEELWTKAVKRANRQPDVFDVAEIDNLDQKAVETLWRVSNFDIAKSVIAASVLREKAPSILVANGTEKAFAILKRQEEELGQKEQEATREVKECEDDINQAIEKLERFEEQAQKTIDDSYLVTDRERESRRMSKELVESIFSDSFFEEVARKMAATVHKVNNEFSGIFPSSYKRRIVEETTPFVVDTFRNHAMNILRSWKIGKSAPDSAWNRFLRNANRLNKDLADLRNQLLADDRLFKELEYPAPSEQFQKDLLEIEVGTPVDDHVQKALEDLRIGFFGNLWEALVWLLSGGGLIEIGRSDDEVVRTYASKLLPKIRNAFPAESLERIAKQYMPGFNRIHAIVLQQLEDGRNAYKRDFEARCDELLKIHSHKSEQKQKIAEENRRLRTEVIQPLRESIHAFQEMVKQELP